MTIKVETAAYFDNNFKHLKRKYPRLNEEFEALVRQLKAGEQPGSKIPNAGYDVYKVRLKNPSAQKGKSGGFRVIYYVRMAEHIILLTIYSKSQQEDIDLETLRRLIADY